MSQNRSEAIFLGYFLKSGYIREIELFRLATSRIASKKLKGVGPYTQGLFTHVFEAL